MLPKNEPVDISIRNKKTIWIYGVGMIGKSTLASKFPNPLFLNTDGNLKFIDSPRIVIKDKVDVTKSPRKGGKDLIKVTPAWEVFKEIVDELSKLDNTFDTIVVDLLEDMYQFCRQYICEREGVDHESDNSFKMWDMVTTEYLNVINKLLTLDYDNIILISHEDKTRDITSRSGDSFTAIKPNLREKVAMKVLGMVDIVGRIVIDSSGERKLSFKTDEVTFGGGRLPTMVSSIPLDYDSIDKLYKGLIEEKETRRKRRG